MADFSFYLFLICPSFGTLGGFSFVIVAFPGNLHFYFRSQSISPYHLGRNRDLSAYTFIFLEAILDGSSENLAVDLLYKKT